MTKEILQLKNQFAHLTAFRISFAAALSMLVVFCIPHSSSEPWFGWFAPFSVIICMLMFPYQNKNHKIFFERMIGVFSGSILSVLGIVIFINAPILMCIYVLILATFMMYQFANHHQYHYGYALGLIFLIIVFAFNLMDRSLVQYAWEFSASIIISIICISIVDFFCQPEIGQKTHYKMKLCVNKLYLDKMTDKPIDMSMLNEWHQHLVNSQAQFSVSEYNDELNSYHLLRLMICKHNTIVEHLPKIKNPKAANLIHSCLLADWHDKTNTINSLEKTVSKQDVNALLCLHELKLLIKDKLELENIKSGKKISFIFPQTPTKQNSKFNKKAFIFSIRSITAIAVALLCVFAFKVPGGVQTVIATIVVAISPTTGAAVLKMLARLSGILIGTLYGFLSLLILSITHSIFFYFALFLPFIYLMCLWSIKKPQYSYCAIQASLLYLMMVSMTGDTNFSTVTSTERLIGVLVGSLISFMVVMFLFPSKPSNIIANAYADIQKSLHNIWSDFENKTKSIQAIRNNIAELDQIILVAKSAASEQKYLNIRKGLHADTIQESQMMSDLLKQLLRAAKEDNKSYEKILKQLRNLDPFSAANTSQQLEKVNFSDEVTAKSRHCLLLLNKHWLIFKSNLQQEGY